MVERVALTGIFVLTLIGARALLGWWTNRYRRQVAIDLMPSDPPLPRWLILAFSTPDCALCEIRQNPALEELTRLHPAQVAVRHVDATAAPELARRFGIFTVPSTVILDWNGRVLAINHTVTGARKLALQLSGSSTDRQR